MLQLNKERSGSNAGSTHIQLTQQKQTDSSIELGRLDSIFALDSSQSSELSQSEQQARGLISENLKINPSDMIPPLPESFRGFRVLYSIVRFIIVLKKKVREARQQNLNPKIFYIVNDRATDFGFYWHNGYFKEKLFALREFMQKNTSFDDWIFFPESKWRLVWNIILLVFSLGNVVYIPFMLAFPIMDSREDFGFFEIFCNYIPWALYIFEVPITLNTAFYHEGYLIADRDEIKQHYIKKGSFYTDVMVILINPLGHFFRPLLLIVWVIRIGRVSDQLAKVELQTTIQQTYTVGWELSKLIGSLVFVNHNVACAWRYLAHFEEEHGVLNNWLRSKGIQDSKWYTQYTYSFYWSTITSTTVGYGDIVPVNEFEMFFVIIMVPITLVLFGYALGSIQSLFVSIKSREDYYTQKMSIVNSYIRKHKLDQQLTMKIRNYFDCYLKNVDNEDEATVLIEQLHDDLKQEVNEQVYRPIIGQSNFISNNISQEVQKVLCQQLKYSKYMPGQNILSNGDTVEDLIFVLSGKIQLYIPRDDGNQYLILQEAQIQPEQTLRFISGQETIAEYNFLMQKTIEYNARAIDYTEVVILKYDDLIKTLKRYPEAYEKFQLTRDNLQFDKYFRWFRKYCEICGFDHNFKECPLAFYQVNKKSLLMTREAQIKQKRQQFHRDRSKFPSRSERVEVIDQAVLVCLDNNIYDESNLSDDFAKKIGLMSEREKEWQREKEKADKAEKNLLNIYPKIILEQESIRLDALESPSKGNDNQDPFSSEQSPRDEKLLVRKTQTIALKKDSPREEEKWGIGKHKRGISHEQRKERQISQSRPQQISLDKRPPRPSKMNRGLTILMGNNHPGPVRDLGQRLNEIHTLHESTLKNEESLTIKVEEKMLDIIRREYMEMKKEDEIIGFEKECEYKYYYPMKNFSVVFAKKKGSKMMKDRRTALGNRLKFSQRKVNT